MVTAGGPSRSRVRMAMGEGCWPGRFAAGAISDTVGFSLSVAAGSDGSLRAPPSRMPDAKTTLLVVLAFVAVAFAFFWVRHMRAAAKLTPDAVRPTPYQLL